MDLPEITEVRRLGLRKGDVIVIRVPTSLDEAAKDRVTNSAQRAFAGLKPAPQVIVLARDMDIEVIGPEPPAPAGVVRQAALEALLSTGFDPFNARAVLGLGPEAGGA